MTPRAPRATAIPHVLKLFQSRKEPPDFDERLTTVERQLKALQVEWMDTLDRLKTMMHRVIKERQRAVEARGDEISPALEGTEVETPGKSGNLSARQLQLNEQILARRNRMRSQ